MLIKATLRRLTQKLRSIGRDRRGNVAIIFALSLLPIIGLIGAGIDYGHAISVRVALQAGLDSTALMLTKKATTLTSGQLQTLAQNYFTALFNRPEAQNVSITATYTTNGGSQVVVSGSANVATNFMQVMGFHTLNVTGQATAKWGFSRLRVALVLDNTGSMADSNKIGELKTATNNLLTQLQGDVQQAGDVYVSIIPFVKDVNLGASNYNASWIDWTDWNSANQSCTFSFNPFGFHCTAANHNTWNGCVVDRGDENAPSSGNYDTNVVAPSTGNTATLFSAEQYSSCPQAAMGLSYDWSSMTTLVNNMSPNGNTNQAIGLALGWMSLVGGGPFTVPAMDPNYTYQQVIILLTDGLNTQDRWYTSQSSIDARQTLTCNNIKAANITLYTVEVSTDGTPLSTLLQNCASDSSKFFFLTNSSQIVSTFSSIGTDLSQLYIAR
jgi:Flp pilus assembly protein TadG